MGSTAGRGLAFAAVGSRELRRQYWPWSLLLRCDGLERTLPSTVHVLVLLLPQLAIDGAALEHLLVGADVGDLALVEDEDLVAIDQRRQPVRDDDHRPPLGHAQEVCV